jgi:superfamily II DNA or RNA helicase
VNIELKQREPTVLRGYQTAAVSEIRDVLRAGKRRVMLYSPTGSGKTEIGIEMVRLAREKSKRVMFVAHRIELIGQAWRRFHQSGIEAGVIQGENTLGMDRPVQIASIQTLAKRGYPEFDLLIIDEAHGVAGSKGYLDLLKACAGKPVVGLSATPFTRGLGRSVENLGEVFEHLAVATTIGKLIEEGHLVDVAVYGPHEPDLSGVKIVAGDYAEGELGRAVDKPKLIGDIVAHWHRLAGGRRTVCFATSIAHSKHIAEEFQGTGVAAEHMDCYTKETDRRAVIGRLNSGETRVLCNVGVLAEGWDCPACEVMILARPTRSITRYIQMAGRVLRPHHGKERALLLDHSGTVRRLGFPTDDLPLELDRGLARSARTEKPEEKLPRLCKACGYLMPATSRACPACGAVPEPRRVAREGAGDLVEMQRGKVGALEKEQVYRELLGYARDHGYKAGWAAHKLRSLFGTWPAKKQGVTPLPPTAQTRRLVTNLGRDDYRKRKASELHAERS